MVELEGELVRERTAALQIVLQTVPVVSDPDIAAPRKAAPRNARAVAADPENGEKAAPVSGFEIVREVGPADDRWGGTVLAGETLAGTTRQGQLATLPPPGSDRSAAGQVVLVSAARW